MLSDVLRSGFYPKIVIFDVDDKEIAGLRGSIFEKVRPFLLQAATMVLFIQNPSI